MLRKILIVEDDEAILEVLTEELSYLQDCHVLCARDGEEALRLALDNKPDITVLDIHLPKLDGYEVCRSLKAASSTRRSKILMISGMAQNADRQKALAAGADDYLTKPFDLTILAGKVKTLIGYSGA